MQVAQIGSVLETALEALWLGGASSGRRVSCVTLLRELAEADQCRSGELIVLLPGGSGAHLMLNLVDTLAARHAAALLLPGDLPAASAEWLREAGAGRDLAIGLLRPEVDHYQVANALSRALGDARPELAPGMAQ